MVRAPLRTSPELARWLGAAKLFPPSQVCEDVARLAARHEPKAQIILASDGSMRWQVYAASVNLAAMRWPLVFGAASEATP